MLDDHDEVHKWDNVLIGVSFTGLRFLIDAPDDLIKFMDGSLFEDNSQSIDKFPTQPGVYTCSIEYWFDQGYFEGWRTDGESEWDFVPSNIKRVEIPAPEIAPEQHGSLAGGG